ncbi:MAG: non-heme iron oxygenase ferredoxin subunit [Actinobacteria bacterium]|nr:non-heme iron oxygenase ferredoxin subunit [Actinomycetota bacterium]NBP53265.1 non-heme iron oxygenase ferredoxin subunit [Actinomycetota bacterium]
MSTKIGTLDDFASGTATKVAVNGTNVAVVRIGDDFYAINDTCSHGNVSLSEGEVHTATKELECMKHGSAFNLENGCPNTLPATQPVAVYTVTVKGDDVFIENGSK